MAIKRRQSLALNFSNGAIPTAKDYRDLIESMVNRRDDCFMGKWRPGMTYYPGEVILFGKSLYVLEGNEEDCETDKEGCIEAPKEGGHCGSDDPTKDDKWCLLQLEIDDDDFELVTSPDGTSVIGVARVQGFVGIGTTTPDAKLGPDCSRYKTCP